MDDENVIGNINDLVAEEHRLLEQEAQGSATDADRARLHRIEVRLDQCWDLLRQRRALREFGRNPDEAEPRDAGTVERYLG